ncbi:hypothetical protein J4401_05715 [Candidatus Woesearchaeota archaeon]|nr:hypothetical protein [Candidatus Woesearchaeota archaeon]
MQGQSNCYRVREDANPEFALVAHEILTGTEFNEGDLTQALRKHGNTFLEYFQGEMTRQAPNNLTQSRFERIADGLFVFYEKDDSAIKTIDATVANIEELYPRMSLEEAFLSEDIQARAYQPGQLQSLNAALTKPVESENAQPSLLENLKKVLKQYVK